jgi:DNA polymerase I-like protein with 3'-5' exonuclease and polymerase domains
MLDEMKLADLAVGHDGRNRTPLRPFTARTGRNQPGSAAYIFGPAVWLRNLIKPEPSRALAYLDWSQQEFGIAAALSQDKNMDLAYRSGDPYLAFAKMARAVPENATKQSHPKERDLYKQCVLATQYGQGAKGLGERIGQSQHAAQQLLNHHHMVFRTFWDWSDIQLDNAFHRSYITTRSGWRMLVGEDANSRSVRNFLMQATGCDLLQHACCLLTEAGISVCGPIHDAILIEASLHEIDATVAAAQQAMLRASKYYLNGYELQSEVEIVRYPNHYEPEKGQETWKTVVSILESLQMRWSVQLKKTGEDNESGGIKTE